MTDWIQDSEISLRKAQPADLDGIMRVMNEAKASAEPGWFVSDDDEYVKEHMEKRGFIIAAEDGKAGIVGFMMIDFPGICEKNLGVYLNLGEQILNQVVHMDSAAVLPAYRGRHLQERMLEMAERSLDQMPQYKYRMCTVHPDNRYSLANLQKLGYTVLTTVYKYNGLLRHVMYKKTG